MADNGGRPPKGPADEGKAEYAEGEEDNQVVVPLIPFLGTELMPGVMVQSLQGGALRSNH